MSVVRSIVDSRRLVAAVVLGAAGALSAGVATPVLAADGPAVTVSITQKGGYTASLCAADILTGTCQDGAKTGQTKKFTVHPKPGSPVEVRVVVDGGGSEIKTVPPTGNTLEFETGGSAAKPTITQAGAPGGHESMPGMDHSAPMSGTPSEPAPTTPAKGPATFLTAELTGAQEVPTPGGPAVGDPDGKASALVEVKGDRVTFAFSWRGISAPTLGHIHEGAVGANGPVRVGLFGTPMPDTVTAAAGQLTVTDAALAQRLRTNPAGFYVNLHTKEFPGGAVRGQLKATKKHLNVLSIVHGGKLRSLDTGGQEVPVAGGPKVGDPDGVAAGFVDAHGSTVDYSFAWLNIAAPTLGHIHQGRAGSNGDVKVPLFGTAVPANVFAVSGTVTKVDPALVQQIRRDPRGFYTNLHTTEFPGGAVRGQLIG
jgi:hypothetical protein